MARLPTLTRSPALPWRWGKGRLVSYAGAPEAGIDEDLATFGREKSTVSGAAAAQYLKPKRHTKCICDSVGIEQKVF